MGAMARRKIIPLDSTYLKAEEKPLKNIKGKLELTAKPLGL